MLDKLKEIFTEKVLDKEIFIAIDATSKSNVDIYKTRPNLVILRKYGQKLYKCKKVYTVDSKYLIPELTSKAIERANNNTSYRYKYSITHVSNYEILYQLLDNVLGNTDLLDEFIMFELSSSNNKTLINSRHITFINNFDNIFFVLRDELEEIIELNKKEKAYSEKENNKQAEYKIITSLMRNTIETICNQYGMTLENDNIIFKDYKGLTNFYNIALNETIIKGLTQNGFTVNKKNTRKKITLGTPLLTLKELGLENNNETDKN